MADADVIEAQLGRQLSANEISELARCKAATEVSGREAHVTFINRAERFEIRYRAGKLANLDGCVVLWITPPHMRAT